MEKQRTSDPVLFELRDGIYLIRFNRPEKKNALTPAMYTAVVESLQKADCDDKIRVVILTGTDSCFTSGNDLLDFMQTPPTGAGSPVMQFLDAISRFRKPVIAAVNGSAVGIGVTMLLHCDLVYAAKSAMFQFPFVNLGLCPEAGSTLLMPLMMGHQRASELLLLGEPFGPEEACSAGIVNAVLPDDELLEHARKKALQLAAQPASAVRLAKSLMKRHQTGQLRAVMAEEAGEFLQRLHSPEAREAMQSFMDRRKPDFSKFA